MDYIILLSRENEIFNNIKKWFINNYEKSKNRYHYYYENELINLDLIRNKSIYIVSPKIIPLLSSLSLNVKNFSYFIGKDFIGNIELKEDSNSVDKIIGILRKYEKNNNIIYKFKREMVNKRRWFYVEDIRNFLDYLEKEYFTWSKMNYIKLLNVEKYKNIIFFDGKNKLVSKKIVEELGINVPKIYGIYDSENEITQEILSKLPFCVIKPTHLDGSKLVIKKKSDTTSEYVRKKLRGFRNVGIKKEILPLIIRYFEPKIIAEEFIPNISGKNDYPCEFKFYIFNRKILFFLAINRLKSENGFDFFNENFEKIPNNKYSYSSTHLNFKWEKPIFFEKIKEDVLKIYDLFFFALNKLYVGRFIRIDFFITKDKYYFGEFSLFPNGGKGNNLNNNGSKLFIKAWIPEVFNILHNETPDSYPTFNYDQNYNEYMKNIISNVYTQVTQTEKKNKY